MSSRRPSALRSVGALAVLVLLWLALGVSPAAASVVIHTIPVGGDPAGVSSDGVHVWVANTYGGGLVTEIDATTGAVLNTIEVLKGSIGAISSDGAHVWTQNSQSATISEIDASTGAVRSIQLGAANDGVSTDGTHVWLAQDNGTVAELAASSGALIQTIPAGNLPGPVASDGTHVWVVNLRGNTVTEIDPTTGTVANTIPVGRDPRAVSSDGTHVWVTNSYDGTVSEIDAATGTAVKTITVGGYPAGVSSDGVHVWVANAYDNTVSEIDASTGVVIQTIPVGHGPDAVSSDGAHVWVANGLDNTVSEIGILNPAPVSLSGMITNSYGRPLPGVKIAITGSQNVTVSTRASGGYSVVEPPGTYTVTAQPANGMFAPQASPACVVRGGACVLTGANGSVQVNFVTQHLPVVLVTGLNEAQAGMTPGRQCTPTATGVMQTLCTVLQAAGFPAYVPSAGRYAVSGDVLTNTLNVDPNASSLMTYLAHTVGGPALLVGHSMGGLFARDAIGRYGAQAAGLFAIGTPFDGSFGADLDMAATVLPSCPYVCAGLRAVGTVLMAYLGKAAVRDLTYLARALDNRTLPPIGIPAWTFAGTACEGPSFLGPYWSPNDGAVGESSAFGVDTLGRGPKQLAGADYHSANVKYAAPLCGAHLNETDDPAIADEVLDAARQLDAPGPARDTPKRARVATSRVRTAPIGHRPIVIHLQQLAGRDIAARATIPMGPGTSVVAGRSFALDCDGRVVQALPGMGGKIFGFPTGALSCQRAALADTKGLRAVIGSDPADVIATLRHQSGPTFTLTLTAARRLSGITLRRGRRRLRVAMHRRGARRIVIRLRATKGAPVTITAAVGGSSYSAILGALG